MSAREDYPAISEWAYEAGHPQLGFSLVQKECQRAMAEIDELRNVARAARSMYEAFNSPPGSTSYQRAAQRLCDVVDSLA